MKRFQIFIALLAILALTGCGGLGGLLKPVGGGAGPAGEQQQSIVGGACVDCGDEDEFSELQQAEQAGAAAKISDLAAATVAAANDVVSGVDVSDTSMAASGTTKKFPVSVLATYLNSDLAVDDLITLSGLAKGSTALADPNTQITATTIDGALTEFAAAIALNTAKYTPTAGTYIDVSNGAVSFDPTEVEDVAAWGAAAGTDKTWTWDTGSGTDPAVNISDSGFSFNKPLLTSVPDGQRWMSAPNTTTLAEIGVNTLLTGSELAELGDKWYRYDATGDDWDDFILFNETTIVDTNNDITATTINGALMEFAAAIELNTAKNTMAWPSGAGVAIYGGSSAWGTSLTLGIAANNIPQLDASAHLGATEGRIVKGWFTDLTVTNAIAGSVTGNAAGLSSTLAVGSGGTGATTLTDGGILLGSGTGAITALGVATNGQIPIGDGTTDPVLGNIAETGDALVVTNGAGTISLSAHANVEAVADAAATDGNFLVGNGTTFVAESGATVRTSLGLGTGDSPQFTGIELGAASDTTLARSAAGRVTVETIPVVLKDADQDIWQSFAVLVSALKADGTNCTAPAVEAINSGPNVWFSTCTDAAGTLELGGVAMPENWDGGNIYVELIAGSNEASPSGTVEFEVQAMARGAGEAINSTWLTTVDLRFASAIDTQYAPEMAESAVIACSGTGGDMLYLKLTRDHDDATHGTSTQAVEIWGLKVYYQIDDLDERD